MIAYDLNYWFYTEEQIRVWELWRAKRELKRSRKFVLQAPALCRVIHELSTPDVAIVLVRRDLDDIEASEIRVKWGGQEHELRQYGAKEGRIAEIKYDYWDNYQKALIHNPFEIEYESLRDHPMWIPKGERVDFGPRQYAHSRDCSKKYRFRPEEVRPRTGP